MGFGQGLVNPIRYLASQTIYEALGRVASTVLQQPDLGKRYCGMDSLICQVCPVIEVSQDRWFLQHPGKLQPVAIAEIRLLPALNKLSRWPGEYLDPATTFLQAIAHVYSLDGYGELHAGPRYLRVADYQTVDYYGLEGIRRPRITLSRGCLYSDKAHECDHNKNGGLGREAPDTEKAGKKNRRGGKEDQGGKIHIRFQPNNESGYPCGGKGDQFHAKGPLMAMMMIWTD